MKSDHTFKPTWPRVRFGDVVRLNKDRSADPAADGIERYVAIEHIEPEDLRIRSWGLVAEGTTFTQRVRPGQTLFVKRRAYQRKVAVAEFDAVCSGDIYVLEPKDDRLLPELLPFLCQTDAFFHHAVNTSAGSLSPRTNWTQLAQYEFALPPLAEQRRIVGVLWAADEFVNAYAESLHSVYTLRSARRKTEFDPEQYKPQMLRDFCSGGAGIQIGPFGAQLHQSDYVETGVPVVMPANMMAERINTTEIARIPEKKAQELAVYRIQPGDILLPRRGELDRRAYVEKHNEGWLCGTGSIRIRVDKSTLSKAVFHALASPHTVRWLNGNAVGTTMPNLNRKIVGEIPVALPPMNRLMLVVEQLNTLERQIQAFISRLAQARLIKSMLLSQVTGAKDVI